MRDTKTDEQRYIDLVSKKFFNKTDNSKNDEIKICDENIFNKQVQKVFYNKEDEFELKFAVVIIEIKQLNEVEKNFAIINLVSYLKITTEDATELLEKTPRLVKSDLYKIEAVSIVEYLKDLGITAKIVLDIDNKDVNWDFKNCRNYKEIFDKRCVQVLIVFVLFCKDEISKDMLQYILSNILKCEDEFVNSEMRANVINRISEDLKSVSSEAFIAFVDKINKFIIDL